MADGPGDDEVGPGRRGGVEKGFMDRPALPRDVLELGLEAVADQVMRSLDPGLAHPKLFVIGHAGDDGFRARSGPFTIFMSATRLRTVSLATPSPSWRGGS